MVIQARVRRARARMGTGPRDWEGKGRVKPEYRFPRRVPTTRAKRMRAPTRTLPRAATIKLSSGAFRIPPIPAMISFPKVGLKTPPRKMTSMTSRVAGTRTQPRARRKGIC